MKPGRSAVSTLRAIKAGALDGKVLVDVANAITESFELVHPNGALGIVIQEALPNTFVVKTLNTVSASVMANPGALP